MTYPVFIQFVQVSHSTITAGSIAVQWVSQNFMSEFDHFHQYGGRITGVATLANHRLQPRRQKTFLMKIERSTAEGTQKQLRENTGQPKHPNFKVTFGKFYRTSLLECTNRHSYQPEYGILRLMLRHKPVNQFNYSAGAKGPIVILEELHRRIQEIRRLDSHQIPVLPLEELNSRMRQRLQRCAKAILHKAGAVGYASKLSMIAAEKSDDAIGLSQGIRLQYNRVALMERHT